MFLLTFPYIGLLRANFMRPAASRLLLSRFLPYPLGSLRCRSLWKQKPLASGCPKKMGQEKGEQFRSYLYVKWNSFGLRFARRRFRH